MMVSLAVSGPDPAPFTWTSPSGRVVSWPDPMVWGLPEAAAWLQHLNTAPLQGMFGALPDPEDRAALTTAALADVRALADEVLEHYSAAWAPPADLAMLAWMLERFPGAVLADLTPLGVDVRSWVAAHRWQDLAWLLHELDSASAVNEAMQNDPEWVEMQVRSETDAGGIDTNLGRSWRPRVRQYDLAAMQRSDISARLEQLQTGLRAVQHAVTQIGARSPKPFNPGRTPEGFPTPRTLLDVRRDEVVAAETWELYAMFQPSRRDLTPDTPEGAPGGHHQDEQEQDPYDDRR